MAFGHYVVKRSMEETDMEEGIGIRRWVWCVQMRCHRSLDLLSRVSVLTKYVIWWTIADNNHSLMRVCGTMVKLVTHSSLLRLDDVRLRTANVRPFLQ